MGEIASDNIVPTIIIGTCIFGVFIIFIVLFVIKYQQKQNAFKIEREALKKALLETEIEIKEQTLTNVSRELHDNLGQIASLVKINLNLVSKNIPKEDNQKITESVILLKELITRIRSLSVSLKSENLERFGLLNMIEQDVERYQNLGEFSVNFNTKADLTDFKEDTAIFLYRMTQEIFNNILKHSKATEVNFSIYQEEKNTIFKFADNGVGFNQAVVKLGSGLINLKERCEIINAKLQIDSAEGKGTTIQIII